MNFMIGEIIKRLVAVDSTNLFMHNALKENSLSDGYVIIAEEQTAGRGQIGNTWESAKNENITLSILLYPHFLSIEDQFMLSKIVSLSIIDCLKEVVPDVKIKWPNDIYVGDRKIAGILIENTIRGASFAYTIVGIGLNVNQVRFSDSVPNPTSLKIETKMDFELEQILKKLFNKLNYWYQKLWLNEFEIINTAYINRLYRFNEFHSYTDENGLFSGKITGITHEGKIMLVDTTNIFREYAFKEVQFVFKNNIVN